MTFWDVFWSVWFLAVLFMLMVSLPKVKTTRDMIDEKWPDLFFFM